MSFDRANEKSAVAAAPFQYRVGHYANSVAPSHSRGWQLPMENSYPNPGKSLLPLTTNDELAQKVKAIVIRFPAKFVGKSAGRTEEAGKAWRQGRACPDLASTINMARDIPAIEYLVYSEIARGRPEGIHSPRLQVEAIALLTELASSDGEFAERARAILSGEGR